MKLIMILEYYFDKWWISLIFTFVSGLFFVFSHFFDAILIENVNFYIFIIAWVGLLVSTVYQLIKKRWIKGIITGIFYFGVSLGFIFFAIATFLIEQFKPDRFADSLYIPSDITIEEPVDLLNSDSRRPGSILTAKKTQIDFVLYNSFQPGLYEYDFWIDKIEKGTIYLKAFEITKNYRLSSDRLKERSAIPVFNRTEDFVRFGSEDFFTIFEGDWYKPYAARFEVWFKPDNGAKEEKLIEKNFKIEGWML